MRRFTPLLGAGLLTLVAVLVWRVQRDPSPPAPPQFGTKAAPENPAPTAMPASGPFVANERNSRAAQITAAGQLIVPDIAATARQLNSPDSTAEQDLEILQCLIAFYRRANAGAGPGGGLNEEIVEQLRGRNTHHLALLPPDLPGTNAAGELLDRWGTPYFFHPVSRAVLEIRSAGPDGKLWTSDDVVQPSADPEAAAGLSRR